MQDWDQGVRAISVLWLSGWSSSDKSEPQLSDGQFVMLPGHC